METIVVKCGGETLENAVAYMNVLEQIAALHQTGYRLVIVHGGGNQIKKLAEERGIPEHKIDGVRVTCLQTMSIVDEVLAQINDDLVTMLNDSVKEDIAESLAGYEMIEATQIENLGYVGEPAHVNIQPLQDILDQNRVAVVYPVCASKEDGGRTRLNVNADSVAAALAKSLKADKIIFCTAVSGVLDADNNVIGTLTPEGIETLIQEGVVKDGMIKKLRECALLLKDVGAVAIVGSADKKCLMPVSKKSGGTLIAATA